MLSMITDFLGDIVSVFLDICAGLENKTLTEREVRAKLHPFRLIGWLPVLLFTVLFVVGGSGWAPLVIISVLWGVFVAYSSTIAWETLRDEKICADIADHNPFLAFSLKGKTVQYAIALIVGVVLAIEVAKLGLSFIPNLLYRIFGENMFHWLFLEFIFMACVYYGGIMVRALRRRVHGSDCYVDGSEYIPKETYQEGVAERDAAQAAEAKKKAEAEQQAAEEEAKKQKAKEAAEEKRRKGEADYEANKEEYRKDVWEWLNIDLNLDFPDEVCDAISDYNLGRRRFISHRRMVPLLSEVVGQADAERYAGKFCWVLQAIHKAQEAEDIREGMEYQKNPLGLEGETNVNYRLKWWMADHPGYKQVAADCFSAHSTNCIRIAAWDYVNEPQEIDHLLVGPAGVIHIETKDYIGTITVKNTHYWERDIKNDGRVTPFSSPSFQVERHDEVIRHIVGDDVPVHALICLSNKNVAIQDAEKSDVPIVCLRDLAEYLTKLHDSEAAKLSPAAVDELFQRIENAKVRNSKKRAEYEKKRTGTP